MAERWNNWMVLNHVWKQNFEINIWCGFRCLKTDNNQARRRYDKELRETTKLPCITHLTKKKKKVKDCRWFVHAMHSENEGTDKITGKNCALEIFIYNKLFFFFFSVPSVWVVNRFRAQWTTDGKKRKFFFFSFHFRAGKWFENFFFFFFFPSKRTHSQFSRALYLPAPESNRASSERFTVHHYNIPLLYRVEFKVLASVYKVHTVFHGRQPSRE